LEDQGASSLREKGGHPVDHIRRDVGSQKSGPEGGGVDVVKTGFDV